MSHSITNFQLSEQSTFPYSISKLSNQTSISTTKSTNAQQSFFDQIQHPSFHKDKGKCPVFEEGFLANFIQRRDEIVKKIAQIYQQTDNESTRTMKLRRLIFIKPMIQEAISIRNLLKNTGSAFFKSILQDLTSDIEQSYKCLQNLQNFYQFQKSLSQAKNMKQTNHIIHSTWQQIYRLSIYDPELISQVSRLEWISRAIDVLSHHRDDSQYPYIEYCQALKKAALASQSEEIIKGRFYKIIEEELQKQKSLVGKLKVFFGQERNKIIRKMDISEVQQLLKELKEFGFEMKREVMNVQQILTKALKIEAVAEQYLELINKKTLTLPNDLQQIILQINNFPIRFPRIEERLERYFGDQRGQFKVALRETAQRIREGNNEVLLKLARYIEDKTLRSGNLVPDPEEVWINHGQDVQEIIQYGENLIKQLPLFKFEDFGRIRREIKTVGFEYLKAELWLAQMKFLQIFCDTITKPLSPITFEELCGFLSEIKDYVKSLPGPKKAPFNEQIYFLMILIQQVKILINQERAKLKKSGKAPPDKAFYAFIDITKEMAEEQFTGKQTQFLESINKKRSSEHIQAYERIEKRIKCQEISQLVFTSSEGEIQRKSQPEIVIIEDLEEKLKRKEVFKIIKLNQKTLNGSLENNERVRGAKVTSEKMKKAEELWKKLDNEKLFDEIYALENHGLGKSNFDINSLLERKLAEKLF